MHGVVELHCEDRRDLGGGGEAGCVDGLGRRVRAELRRPEVASELRAQPRALLCNVAAEVLGARGVAGHAHRRGPVGPRSKHEEAEVPLSLHVACIHEPGTKTIVPAEEGQPRAQVVEDSIGVFELVRHVRRVLRERGLVAACLVVVDEREAPVNAVALDAVAVRRRASEVLQHERVVAERRQRRRLRHMRVAGLRDVAETGREREWRSERRGRLESGAASGRSRLESGAASATASATASGR